MEVEEEEEQKGPDLKLASRRDMYSICQSAGLGKSPLLISNMVSLSLLNGHMLDFVVRVVDARALTCEM